MTNNLRKYGILSIAAVLLVALAFAGAGAAYDGIPAEITGSGYTVVMVDDESGGIEYATPVSTLGYPAYLIEDTADWNAVACNESYNGAVLVLGDNLDFTGMPGSNMMNYPFGGKIYGNGYLIENFTNLSDSANVGLIRKAGDGLYLNYIMMTNTSLCSDGKDFVGPLVGLVSGNTTATIIGCTVFNASLTNVSSRVGGLVGFVSGSNATLVLKHSGVFNTTINATSNNIGGLIGRVESAAVDAMNCTVTDCWIESSGDGSVGGFVGLAKGKKVNISESTSVNNTIKGKGWHISGLVGYASAITIDRCNATNCDIMGPSNRVGGLVGTAENSAHIMNSTIRNSNVSVGGGTIGGLVGCQDGAYFENCSILHSNVKGVSNTGGIVGWVSSHGERITYCHAGIIGEDAATGIYVQSGRPLGGTLGVGCDNATLQPPLDLTFSTKEEKTEFPASRLPYVYVTYRVPAGYVGVPYSDGKQSVAMPYFRSAVFDKDRVKPVNGDVPLIAWLNEDGDTRLATPVVPNEVVTGKWGQTTVRYHSLPTDENVSITYVLYQPAVTPTPVRVGYHFNAWNLSSADGYPFSGNTTYFAENGTWKYTGNTDPLDVYANWTANTYTVSFVANGGTGSMAGQEFIYDAEPEKLSSNTFSKSGYVFAGWSTSLGGAVIYTDTQSVQNIAAEGTLPLYAVWTDRQFAVTVTLVNGTAPYTVQLMRGNETIKENLSVPGTECIFTDVSCGTYDIVAEDSSSFRKKVTRMLDLVSQNASVILEFPLENVSSEVIVSEKDNTPAVVIGGLDKEAEANAEPLHNVTMTLTVQAKDENSPDTNATIAIAAIKENTTGPVVKDAMQFLDINVNKTVDTVTESVNETTELIEIVVPYDFTGKDRITVYRYHEGVYEPLVEIFNEADKVDGTYLLARANGQVKIYAQKFSMYSIGYTLATPAPAYTPSSSHNSGYTVILPEGQAAPTVAPTTAPTGTSTVVPTANPTTQPTTTPKTPAPFAGLVLGLGAAAVLLRLRR